MSNYLVLSNTNPLKFYAQGDTFGVTSPSVSYLPTFDPSHNTRTIDQDFYYRNIPKWLAKIKYFQPFQLCDNIVLQWEGVQDLGLGSPFTVRILNGQGGVVASYTPTDGADLTVTERIYSVIIPLYDIPEGTYFVQIKMLGYFTISDRYWISEPISVKAKHEGTVQIKYFNSSNDYGIYYDSEGQPPFTMRVHAQLKEMQPISKFNVYDNDPMELEMLGGVKSREYTIEYGGNRNGFPLWLLDKLEVISLHDQVTYDGIGYTRIEGSTLEKSPIRESELFTAKLKARPRDNNTDLVTTSFEPIAAYEAMPRGQVIYVESIDDLATLGDIPIQKYFLSHDHFLAYLNSYISFLVGQLAADDKMHFSIDATNRLICTCYNDTSYTEMEAARVTGVMDNYQKVTIKSDGATLQTLQFDLTELSFTDIAYAFFYNDGNDPLIDVYNFTVTLTHDYAEPGEYTAYLFVQNANIIELSNSDNFIKSIAMKLPDECVDFVCSNNTLRDIESNPFLYLTPSISLLETFNVRGNYLPKSIVSQMIIWAYEANKGLLVYDALVVLINSQFPLAPPLVSDSGLQRLLSELRTTGLTITTD